MKPIEYNLTKEDLLQYYLYGFSISPTYRKQRKRNRIYVPLIYIFLALILFTVGATVQSAGIMIIAAGWFLLIPHWMRRRNRKHFENHIDETMGEALRNPVVLKLLPDGIFYSHIGESKYKYSVVDRIVENEGYTYIFLGKGLALILPHDRIPDETIKSFVSEVQEWRADQQRAAVES